ncbi:MAG: D-aminoacyl-tRNA deacylase [Nitrospiraceae bacterium]|nr:D-aminoacyl-tRNA deacylase [Nitrospiraceae bacterium]
MDAKEASFSAGFRLSWCMIAVLQRVSRADVAAGGMTVAGIGEGLLVLLCAVKLDGDADLEYCAKKIARIRIFDDENGRMNRSVAETAGEVLLVSQFTLSASTRKGNRPSFENAEAPDRARLLCDQMASRLREAGIPVKTGEFGAMMKVSLVNDGPVTVIIDSRERTAQSGSPSAYCQGEETP